MVMTAEELAARQAQHKRNEAAAELLTWAQMVRLQPGLDRLLKEIEAVKDDKTRPGFCANAWWYGFGSRAELGFKSRFIYLVGFHCRNADPRMRTMAAYDKALHRLYQALPNCRNCNCIGM